MSPELYTRVAGAIEQVALLLEAAVMEADFAQDGEAAQEPMADARTRMQTVVAALVGAA